LDFETFAPLFGMLQFFFVIVLTVLFTRFYCQDKDKRKLMFIIAFLFVSPAYFGWINEELQSVLAFEKYNAWSALPVTFAVLTTSLSTLNKNINPDALFKTFLGVTGISVVLSTVSVFVENDVGTTVLISLALVAIGLSVYACVKSKKMCNGLFVCSLLCFTAGGLMIRFSFPVGLAFVTHATAFLFIFLVFYFAREGDNKLNAFFAVQKKLDKANEVIKTQEEKMRIMGSLTRHDVRNKLSVILNNVYLTKQSLYG
jgi:hypothetical protein